MKIYKLLFYILIFNVSIFAENNNNDGKIPHSIWDSLDLGTKRRLHQNPRWNSDPNVRQFISQQHQPHRS